MPITFSGSNGIVFDTATSNGQITQSYPALGSGQSWQSVTASRAKNTLYTNSTNAPIMVYVLWQLTGGGQAWVSSSTSYTNAYTWGSAVSSVTDGGLQFIVPVGQTYYCTGGNVIQWNELR